MSSRGLDVIDLQRVKTLGGVLGDSLRCYGAYPGTFAALTLVVMVPYALLVWVTERSTVLGVHGHAGVAAGVLPLVSSLIVQPLISALHVNALVDIGEGKSVILTKVFRRGVIVLPVVAAAEVSTGFGIAFGLILLIIPGLFLAARWAVVAQVAAIERTSWIDAIHGSAELTHGHYLHVLRVVITVVIIVAIVNRIFFTLVGTGDDVLQIVIGIAIETVLYSFSALTTAMLYYDLLARRTATSPPES